MLGQRGDTQADQTHETTQVEHTGSRSVIRLPRGWGVTWGHDAAA